MSSDGEEVRVKASKDERSSGSAIECLVVSLQATYKCFDAAALSTSNDSN